VPFLALFNKAFILYEGTGLYILDNTPVSHGGGGGSDAGLWRKMKKRKIKKD
jgi:hypothetical protein